MGYWWCISGKYAFITKERKGKKGTPDHQQYTIHGFNRRTLYICLIVWSMKVVVNNQTCVGCLRAGMGRNGGPFLGIRLGFGGNTADFCSYSPCPLGASKPKRRRHAAEIFRGLWGQGLRGFQKFGQDLESAL